MRQYRFTRRSFLAGIGGAAGLKVMLRNIEASAAGAAPPPRFLMTHWPVGTVHYNFIPEGSGTSYTPSRILQPFEDKGLREDTIILYGLDHSGLSCPGGGGHEAGTPFMTTGSSAEGTRANGGEGDDGVAGGPSMDQVFLRVVPELQTDGFGYVNAICDKRIDSQETSTRCLSYSYTKRTIDRAGGGQIQENTPLLPEGSPALLWMQLFGGFSVDPMGNPDLLKGLIMRKSVLDHSRDELAKLRLLVPSSEYSKLDAHAEIVRKIEEQLQGQIDAGGGPGDGCTIPVQPDGSLEGKDSSRSDYNNPETSTDDSGIHEQVGIAHSSIIRAAFQCDIIRVATFQWSPGTNHVSFGPAAGEAIGLDHMYPDNPSQIYMHHPVSHRIGNRNDVVSSRPSGANGSVVDFLTNCHTWYNTKTADIILAFKNATDINGANLLDHTIIPYVTEVAETTHSRSPLQSLIFGGRALGMQGGQYQRANTHMNSMWMTCLQALMKTTSNPVSMLTGNDYSNLRTQGVAPISGLYTPV